MNCPNVKFPYLFCYQWELPYPTQSKILLYCTDDPNYPPQSVEWDGHNGRLCPIKIPLPVCTRFDEETVPSISFPSPFQDILTQEQARNDLEDAAINGIVFAVMNLTRANARYIHSFLQIKLIFKTPKNQMILNL